VRLWSARRIKSAQRLPGQAGLLLNVSSRNIRQQGREVCDVEIQAQSDRRGGCRAERGIYWGRDGWDTID
jgi:hypothetical protein